MSSAQGKSVPLWMPLNIADYHKDTQHLSALEHGAYMLLLMHCWTTGGSLPADEKRLSRIAKLTPKEWRESRDILLDFFFLRAGAYRHKRIDVELAKADELIEKKRTAGRQSAAARAERARNGSSTGVDDVLPEFAQNGATENEQKPNQSQSQSSVDKSTAHLVSDPVKLLFDLGVGLLTEQGHSESRARSLVGKWREGGRRDGEVAAALVEAKQRSISNLVEWMPKRLGGEHPDPQAPKGDLVEMINANPDKWRGSG